MALLKPVIYLTIGGKRFHWATTLDTPDAKITKLIYEETDGTGKASSHKKDKGKRDSLKFTFVNYNSDTQTFLTDSNVLKVGSEVRFRFGFEGTFSLSTWRTFKIVEVEETFPDNGIEMATVVCHDLSKDMNNEVTDVARPRTKLKKKEDETYSLADVVQEVATDNGFSYFPSDQKVRDIVTNGWQQSKETDMQFLQRLAKTYGMEVYVTEDKTLFFGTKGPVVKQPDWGVLHRGEDEEYTERVQKRSGRVALILTFTPKVNLEDAASEASSADVSSSTNAATEKKSESTRQIGINMASGLTNGLVNDPEADSKKKKLNGAPLTDSDAKAKAEAEQQLSNDSAITADVTCEGHPALVAKTNVRLTGRISKRWKKHRWYVETVNHDIDASSGYQTTLSLTLTPAVEAAADANKADTSKNNKNTPEGSREVPVNPASGKQTGPTITVPK
jgi:phage protein D